MPHIHELLDETQKQCQALVDEVQAFKSAKTVNKRAADGLESVCEALTKTTIAIKPFTELRFRRFMQVAVSLIVFNLLISLTILITLIFVK